MSTTRRPHAALVSDRDIATRENWAAIYRQHLFNALHCDYNVNADTSSVSEGYSITRQKS
eukprot:4252543-Amphidinium_carterae.1